MIHGGLQTYPLPLTLIRFFDHVTRWHGEAEVVGVREGGGIGPSTPRAI